MSQDLLDRLSDAAFAQLEAVGGDPRRLPEAARTVAVVFSAQGVIDNGGLRRFFENPWPGEPPYALFADAYRRIGATAEADAILAGAALFDGDGDGAQLDVDARLAAMDDACVQRLAELDRACDGDVWALLTRYATGHQGEIEST